MDQIGMLVVLKTFLKSKFQLCMCWQKKKVIKRRREEWCDRHHF
jgi:hypothetical protein